MKTPALHFKVLCHLQYHCFLLGSLLPRPQLLRAVVHRPKSAVRPSRAADGAFFLEERAAAVGALQGEAEAPGDDGRLRVPEGHAAESKVVFVQLLHERLERR